MPLRTLHLMSEAVVVEQRGAVCLISVDDGRANAFSPDLLASLSAAVATAEGDESIRAAVIAGREGLFGAGFDLDVIRSGDSAAITAMVTAGGSLVRQVYGARIPVVAACTGHAVAAGALLLLGCDIRVGPDSDVKIGLNEVAIALSLPAWALAIAKERLSRRHLQRCVVNAQLVDGAGARNAGFLDEVVAPDQVVARALAVAEELAATLDPRAYGATVDALRSGVLGEMDAAITADRERLSL